MNARDILNDLERRALELSHTVTDDGYCLQVHEHYGTLDMDASLKAARLVRFCDAFNIPRDGEQAPPDRLQLCVDVG